MTWFRVDDTFAMHERVLAAGNAAVGLWVRCGSWSMQQLTDGFVPNHVLRALGTPKERRTLVEVSLWVEVDGGVQFRNWEERQPSKEQVVSARQAAAERQRNARERKKSQEESRRDEDVSHGPPDPTQPNTSTEVDVGAAGAEPDRSKTKRATARPADFRPTKVHIDLAAEHGVNLHAEWPKFCDWCDATGRTYKNWGAALSGWIRRAPQFAGSSRPQPPVEDNAWMKRSLP